MGLDGQNNDVLRLDITKAAGGPEQSGDFLAPVPIHKLQPIAIDRLQMRAARNQRDVLACQGEPHAQVPTDRTGANHTNFHNSSRVML